MARLLKVPIGRHEWEGDDMPISRRVCPDCGLPKRDFTETITGRTVCTDCGNALHQGSVVGAVVGMPAGVGVWQTLMAKLRAATGKSS